MIKQILTKVIYLILFSILFSFSSIAQNKEPSGNEYCNAFAIEKITLGIDTNHFQVYHDTVRTIYVTIINTCRSCKIEGPDYCLLSVIDMNNDTVGSVSINGVPEKYKDRRTYPAFAYKKWKKTPDIKKLIVSLPPYCNRIKYMIK